VGLVLSEYEHSILEGKKGEAARLAMEVIVALGNAFGARELVKVASVQAMAHYGSLHDAGVDWLERLASLGGRCCVPCTQDPSSIPFHCWSDLGIPPEYADKQMRLAKAVVALGEIPSWTCTPYYVGNVPRFGQNVAWAESSAVSFANSVLGARTERVPAGLAVCAALTGRIPRTGLYLDENRAGSILVKVEAGPLSGIDYPALGYILGTKAGTRIPVLDGISADVTNDDLKNLGAAAATSGSVALYHVPGVTPEALTGDPFHGGRPSVELSVTRRDIEATKQTLTTGCLSDVDLVVLGCPHYSIWELQRTALLLAGRKVRLGRRIWIHTSAEAEQVAARMGLLEILREAGATVLAQNCLVISPLCIKGVRTIATDSGKAAGYLPCEHRVRLVFTSTEECIASVTE
jgi:hypothetical protein